MHALERGPEKGTVRTGKGDRFILARVGRNAKRFRHSGWLHFPIRNPLMKVTCDDQKSRNQVRALVLAGLAGFMFSAGTCATEAQVVVGALDTSVKLLSLHAGEAFAFDETGLSDAGKAKPDAILADLQ